MPAAGDMNKILMKAAIPVRNFRWEAPSGGISKSRFSLCFSTETEIETTKTVRDSRFSETCSRSQPGRACFRLTSTPRTQWFAIWTTAFDDIRCVRVSGKGTIHKNVG